MFPLKKLTVNIVVILKVVAIYIYVCVCFIVISITTSTSTVAHATLKHKIQHMQILLHKSSQKPTKFNKCFSQCHSLKSAHITHSSSTLINTTSFEYYKYIFACIRNKIQ